MQSFLEAFYADDEPRLDAAVACMDLSGVPAELRTGRGRELAVELKHVLDRTRYVRFEEIPDRNEGPPYVFLRTPDGEVVVARQPDGRWLFTADTVASIDELHRATRGREVVEGVQRQAPDAVTISMRLREAIPDLLRGRFFLLESWQWLGLFGVLLVGVIASRITVGLARGALDRAMRRRRLRVKPELLTRTLNPAGVLVMVVVWGFGIAWLGLPVGVLRLYLGAVKLVAIFAAVVTAYQLVNVLGEVLERRAARTESRFDDLLIPLIRKSVKVFVVAVGIALVAGNLQIDVTGLLAGLGLGGLAFALAAKDTVGNLFGSLTVLLDRPFSVGDWVVIGDVEGTVEELGFRSTRIRTFYNSLITVPNINLSSASVDNLGARAYRRWKTTIGITYDTPPERIDAFCEGIRELVERHPYTRKDYYHVYMNDFGESALEILLYVFFRTPDWATELRERHRLGVDIARLAAELGVEFAFPSRTLYLRREEWSPAEAAGEGYPGASERLSGEARVTARRLVDDAVGQTVPPPVTFSTPTNETRGECDEGE